MSQSSTSDPPSSPSSGIIVAGLPRDSNDSVKPSCTSDTDAYKEVPRHANNVTSNSSTSNPIISSSENASNKTESNSSSSCATADRSSANRRGSGLSNLMSALGSAVSAEVERKKEQLTARKDLLVTQVKEHQATKIMVQTASLITDREARRAAMQSQLDENQQLKDIVESADKEITAMLADKRGKFDAEITLHFLDGSKYGVAGSDGTLLSNFKRYYANNHPLVAICLADKRNPYDKKRRYLNVFNMINITFFLNVMFLYGKVKNQGYFTVELYISLISAPCTMILDKLARCEYFNRTNKCIGCSTICGLITLAFFYFLSLGLLITGIVLLSAPHIIPNKKAKVQLAVNFFESLALGWIVPYILQTLNWILPSWDGFLLLPSIKLPCCGRLPRTPICPLLNKVPFNYILGLFGLGGPTYDEDKRAFEEKYPGRIAIDTLSEEEYNDWGRATGIQDSNANHKSEPINSHNSINNYSNISSNISSNV